MLVAKPKMHPLAAEAVGGLLAAGAVLDPADYLWLQDAAVKVARETRRDIDHALEWPVPVGGALLWPLTFGALDWLERIPGALGQRVAVIAYAMHHSRDRATLESIAGIAAVQNAVKAWVRRLDCSPWALQYAVNEVVGDGSDAVEVPDAVARNPEARPRQTYSRGAVLDALCARYHGTTPGHWWWEVSLEQASEMLARATADLPESKVPTGDEVTAHVAFRSVVNYLMTERRPKPAPATVGADNG